MRIVSVLACALVAACFSKPPNNTGGGDDAGVHDDAPDAPIDGPPIDPASPLLIATGGKHACRIDDMKRVLCWGNDNHQQLGIRSFLDPLQEWSGEAEPASPLTGWTSIAAGEQHTCGVRAEKVYCWGENNFAQSNPANFSANNIAPVEVMLPGPAAQVFAAGFTSCAILMNGEAYCWGQVDFQVASTKPMTPLRLGSTTFVQIALADDHGCALDTAGRVHCWGEAEQLQTGRVGPNALDPVLIQNIGPISSTNTFTSIAAGHEATCGVTGGTLVCWGTINAGQLGPQLQGPIAYQVVDASTTWTRVAVGFNHVCAVKDGGDVYCYGDDRSGALGAGRFADQRAIGPKVNLGTMKVSQVSVGLGYSCALSLDALQLRCWGSNAKGELGNRMAARKQINPAPAMLPPGNVTELVAGDDHTCALIAGSAYCWGRNHEEQIGTSSGLAKHAVPMPASARVFTKLTAGEKHTCGIVVGSAIVECWGENDERQLGATTLGEVRATLGGANWTDISAGSRMTCGIDSGDLFCWGAIFGGSSAAGKNPIGRVDGTTSGNPWLAISVGSGFGVGVFQNNGFRLAGIARMTDRRCAAGYVSADMLNTPEEILAGYSFGSTTQPMVSAAQSGGEHACFHHAGNPKITCVGGPNLDQVGGPVTCGNLSNLMRDVPGAWASPAAPLRGMFVTGDHSCALDTGDHVKCWGGNSSFELGDGFQGSTPTPTLVHGTYLFESIAGGSHHTCGIQRSDHRVYCWGENEYGQVGDGTSWEPSPVVSGVYP